MRSCCLCISLPQDTKIFIKLKGEILLKCDDNMNYMILTVCCHFVKDERMP